ncbi:hypothetical protein EZS27_012701 [termite gut metagenome]|uniref:TonB-dependent receptor SusC n=1 Tax=termite gut metagenome TaxID=433724 RepID=A0A5J4S2C7_9ZZZZ
MQKIDCKLQMKNFFILSILLLQTVVLPGQGTITCSIVDKATQSLVEYANIALYTQNGHNYVLGTVTDFSGKFSIENIAFGNYELEYSFLGFEKTETLKVRLDKNHSVANVGILELAESFQTLDEVVVMGRKSTYVTQIDKGLGGFIDNATGYGSLSL